MRFYQFFIFFICNTFLTLFNAFTATADVDYTGPVSVEENSNFAITCRASPFSYIKWRLNDSIYDFGVNNPDETKSDRFISSTMSVSSAKRTHNGKYKCSREADDFGHNLTVVLTDSTYKLTLTTTVKNSTCQSKTANKNGSSSRTQCLAGYPFEEFPLKCEPDPKLDDDHTIVWYKKSKSEPETLIENNERISISNNNLIIKSLDVVDALLQYQCRVVKKGDGNANTQPISQQAFELIVKPRVSPLKKELNVIENENVTLSCSVTASIPVTVKWIIHTPYWLDKPFDKSNERIELRSNGTMVMNNELIIKSANMSLDRGTYTCSAVSEEGNSTGSTPFMVRVKSKYAALWPFLGICAEVFILCTVILIYEKKRDKTELEESDTDQGPETKSSPDHGQDNVRYRK